MTEPGGKKTTVSELGKFALIEHLTKDSKTVNKSTIVGIGDDSAVIDNGNMLTIMSADLLLEGIHFDLTYTPLKHLGYKAVVRGISDIYAMNGKPGQILISIGISTRFTVENLEELYDGIFLACKKYRVDLAGGDTTTSLTGLTIGISVVGTVESDKIVKRNGAKPNDLICVTGDLGASYLGLQLLERERKLFKNNNLVQPDLSGYEYVIGRQLKPEFPSEILTDLRKSGVLPTSMIDISDGLASDLLHICKASGTGCRIFSNKIPVDQETFRLSEEFRLDPVTAALNGGEDYELLFTVSLEMFDKMKLVPNVKIIGHMTVPENGKMLVPETGSEIELIAQGWK